jgi:hypothetical protein
LLNLDSDSTLKKALRRFGDNLDPYGADELAVLPILCLKGDAIREKTLKIAADRVALIEQLRTVAADKISAVLEFARFALPISRKDAEEFFRRAHALTEAMDCHWATASCGFPRV